MIFNWRNNCIKILQTNEYSHNDRWEKKEEYRQQIWLIAYLVRLGWDKERIRKKWESIPAIQYSAIDSLHPEELDMYFDTLYNKGVIAGGTNSFRKMDNVELVIYQEEIDEINKILTSYEFRKYLFMLLAVYKYYSFTRGACYFDSKVRGYAFETSNPGKKYGDYSEALVNLNREAGCPIQSKIVKQFHISHLNFAKETGTPVVKFHDPVELVEHLNVIKRPKLTCKICGKKFVYTTKTKKDICDDCYAKQRQEYERIRKRQYSQRSRNRKHHYELGESIATELALLYLNPAIEALEMPVRQLEPWEKVAQEFTHIK